MRAVLGDDLAAIDAHTLSVAATALSTNDDIVTWLQPRFGGVLWPLDDHVGPPPPMGPVQVGRLVGFAAALPDYLAPDALAVAAMWHMVCLGPDAQSHSMIERALRIEQSHDLSKLAHYLWHAPLAFPDPGA